MTWNKITGTYVQPRISKLPLNGSDGIIWYRGNFTARVHKSFKHDGVTYPLRLKLTAARSIAHDGQKKSAQETILNHRSFNSASSDKDQAPPSVTAYGWVNGACIARYYSTDCSQSSFYIMDGLVKWCDANNNKSNVVGK